MSWYTGLGLVVLMLLALRAYRRQRNLHRHDELRRSGVFRQGMALSRILQDEQSNSWPLDFGHLRQRAKRLLRR